MLEFDISNMSFRELLYRAKIWSFIGAAGIGPDETCGKKNHTYKSIGETQHSINQMSSITDRHLLWLT